MEFDESQHFTLPRKISLQSYGGAVNLGFPLEKWIELCETVDAKDNDPPYRDEQRAWYDTLRDFLPVYFGLGPTVRLFAGEMHWCSLNPDNPEHVKAFKDKIEGKQLGETEEGTAESSHRVSQLFNIGLAFPELNKHQLEDFLPIVRKYHRNLDLLIFPEGFETVVRDERTEPEAIANVRQVKKISEKYQRFCEECKLSIILGVQVDYQNTSINGSGNDQYCLFVGPGGEPNIYHKHSSSRFNAFFDENWSVESNFLVRSVKDVNVGISICHDMYISLIPKVLKKKGTDVWVNISF